MPTTMRNTLFTLVQTLEASKVRNWNLNTFYFNSQFSFAFLLGIDLFNEEQPYTQNNLQTLDTLTRDSKITAMTWADDNENELLIGRGDSVIRTFDCSLNQFMETDLNIPESAVVGLAWTNE